MGHRGMVHPVDAIRVRWRELADLADELLHRVDDALAAETSQSVMVETRAQVEALAAATRSALADLDPKMRAEMERKVGRKVVDLQHRAARLPTLSSGSATTTTANHDFVENRPPPPASRPIAPGPSAPRKPTRATPAKAKGAAPRKPTSASIQASLEDAAVVKAYSITGTFELGDVIAHPTFGRGRVEGLQPRTIKVLFASGMKSLRTA